MALGSKEKQAAAIPQHIGIIMDGNGRWAKKRGLPRTAGHTAGAANFRTITRYAASIGVKYLTLYAFSTENWNRPAEEVSALMKLFHQYLEEALRDFSLDGDWFPFTRSRGERQRLALASVLICRPKMVILDEPTTGLDYKECIAIMDYITRLNRETGLTVLMVSHDMELVQQYAKRVLVLTNGQLQGDGPVNEIMKDLSILEKAHVRPAQIPALALRFGDRFKDVYTVDEMAAALKAAKKGGVPA